MFPVEVLERAFAEPPWKVRLRIETKSGANPEQEGGLAQLGKWAGSRPTVGMDSDWASGVANLI
jgi:hypothetical protein